MLAGHGRRPRPQAARRTDGRSPPPFLKAAGALRSGLRPGLGCLGDINPGHAELSGSEIRVKVLLKPEPNGGHGKKRRDEEGSCFSSRRRLVTTGGDPGEVGGGVRDPGEVP